MNHIIHDIDRDGWGSAAMILAQLGAENCRLYPTRDKEIFNLIRNVGTNAGDVIWVLDIPGPTSWMEFPSRNDVRTIWIDHHLNSWEQDAPKTVEVVLPKTKKATTTMSVLASQRLVSFNGAMDFARSLCSRGNESEWGLVFDGLTTLAPHFPVPIIDLPKFLAGAPKGEPIPDKLKSIVVDTRSKNETVTRVLREAKWKIGNNLAVAYIANAQKIPLGRYSLHAAALHPDKVRVLVHRSSLIYCGRNSQKIGIDLFQHFKSRGLEPKGHAYVCFVNATSNQVQAELDALRVALGEKIE